MSQEQLGATLTSLGLQAVATNLTPEQEERAWQLINELRAMYSQQVRKAS
jgi:hypothetical protein